MQRRSFIAASAAALATPALAQAPNSRVLRFIPQADLTVLDPMWTTAYVTRNHGFMVYDTLFGQDGNYAPSPQMLEGFTTDNDGRLWTLTLRPGLKFHDNEPVRAQDCVASIARWGKRDAFGGALLSATDELVAKDDRTIVFRLKRPFALLPAALAKTPGYNPVIMPERLAKTDAMTQVTEMIGSGPFRFKADERIPGARAVYEKFQGYVPRESGKSEWTAGPKIVHFDRVEWTTIPDPTTAAQALINGEQDWWDYATVDLMPLLQRSKGVKVVVQEPSGQISILRMNHLQPPFNNPAIRRAILGAVDQADVMQAVVGTDPTMWHDKVGVFCPGTPFASTAGMDVLTGPRDYNKVKADLKAAGYNGEKVVIIVASDFPVLKAMADVGADFLTKAGMNVDYQSLDWGTVLQRRTRKDPPTAGGWNIFFTAWAGTDMLNPAGHLSLRANGEGPGAWFGWPTSPKIESLRDAWFDAPDFATQKKICDDIQRQVLIDLPYVPLGQYLQATAYRDSLTGVNNGFAMFWNVKRI
jgi:peptide/nickel transport system substrate-binding protein